MGVVSRKTSKGNESKSSSTSVSDEQLEGEGPLTPIDRMEDDVVDDDDDLSALNSLLQTGSAGSLSDEEHEDDEEEPDSASSLSSLPDDFPLSRSTSPEKSSVNLRKRKKSVDTKKIDTTTGGTTNSRISVKRAVSEEIEVKDNENNTVNEDSATNSKRRRVSETTRILRRSSKQDEKQASPEIQTEKVIETNTLEEEKEKEEKVEEITPLPAVIENVDDQKEDENEIQDNNDQDYQQRHKDALDALTQIEVEFARLRDKMYEEKMAELNDEATMIANGTHPELVSLMAEIEEKKGNRIHSAEAWRRYQHANFKEQFEGFEYQANIHFISQKNALRRTLLNELNNKKWSIEDERLKVNEEDRIIPDGQVLTTYKKEQKEETDELQDINEIIGFPMAPNPSGLSIQDVDDDLKLLGLGHH